MYAVSGREEIGRAAKVNLDIALSLTTKGKDPQVSLQHAGMTRLK